MQHQGRPEANTALDNTVAEHALTVLARKRTVMPLTAGFMQAVAQQGFGHKVGERRAAKMVGHLKHKKLIAQVSRYRGKQHGFWVAIYTIRTPSSQESSSVRRNSSVKRTAWWQHGLFGNPNGDKPPGATEEKVKRWRSRAFKTLEFERAT